MVERERIGPVAVACLSVAAHPRGRYESWRRQMMSWASSSSAAAVVRR